MANVRFALLYVVLLMVLVTALVGLQAILMTGALNARDVPTRAVMLTFAATWVLALFLAPAVLFFRVAGWAHRRVTGASGGVLAHLARCAPLYAAFAMAGMGVRRQAQTDVQYPWSFVLSLALPALAGAICGVLLAERRAAVASTACRESR